MPHPPTNTSYQGTQFFAAVLDLPPQLRRGVLDVLEVNDFTTKPAQTIYRALLDLDGLDTIDGRINTGIALFDYLRDSKALEGATGHGVKTMIGDIATAKATGNMAHVLVKQLREDRYRGAVKHLAHQLAEAADTAPKDDIDALLADNLDELRRLSIRCTKPRSQQRDFKVAS